MADKRRSNHVPIQGFVRDEVARDWLLTAGDLTPTTSMSAIFEQALRCALECRFGSMRKVLPEWGNEGLAVDFSDQMDDTAEYNQREYIREILDVRKGPLSSFLRTITNLDFDFPGVPGSAFPLGTNGWSFRLGAVLNDQARTAYNRLFTWDGTTARVTVS